MDGAVRVFVPWEGGVRGLVVAIQYDIGKVGAVEWRIQLLPSAVAISISMPKFVFFPVLNKWDGFN